MRMFYVLLVSGPPQFLLLVCIISSFKYMCFNSIYNKKKILNYFLLFSNQQLKFKFKTSYLNND